jgi:hypothetical protein
MTGTLSPQGVEELAIRDAVLSLTVAQRDFLLFLPADGSWKRTTERDFTTHGPNALRGFGQSDLIEGYYQEEMRHRLTAFGVRVVAHILSTQGEEQ